jgi:hypothetical protein
MLVRKRKLYKENHFSIKIFCYRPPILNAEHAGSITAGLHASFESSLAKINEYAA